MVWELVGEKKIPSTHIYKGTCVYIKCNLKKKVMIKAEYIDCYKRGIVCALKYTIHVLM